MLAHGVGTALARRIAAFAALYASGPGASEPHFLEAKAAFALDIAVMEQLSAHPTAADSLLDAVASADGFLLQGAHTVFALAADATLVGCVAKVIAVAADHMRRAGGPSARTLEVNCRAPAPTPPRT